ncbi:hypothetical protein GALMADRAFT_254931 [Galerina marginata CBS 339.88]|uniref:Uncharacterized protein n=1 Tax=Galerina marginata (strain CBS 339.88) TaxID=685588 RepID=A0A067STM4_GALM3|nr:hypothetical protein GALMADRAFT_254931 [Galerina marginata CBS 339.88]
MRAFQEVLGRLTEFVRRLDIHVAGVPLSRHSTLIFVLVSMLLQYFWHLLLMFRVRDAIAFTQFGFLAILFPFDRLSLTLSLACNTTPWPMLPNNAC